MNTEADRNILNGPDTKTKRWLQKHLAEKDKDIKFVEQEPVVLANAIKDIPF